MTLINLYAPNDIASKYVKQKLTELQGEIDNKPSGKFQRPLSEHDTSADKKKNKKIKDTSSKSNNCDLVDIERLYQ